MSKKIDWKKTTRFKGPEESPGFLLWQVSTEWRRSIETALATIDLTHPQFVLLASIGWLTQNEKKITQAELARHCRTDLTMTSQVLRTLERKGLIERKKQEGDEKSKFPFVTSKGAQLIAKAIPLVEEIDHSFFNRLDKNTPKFSNFLQILLS